MINNYEKKVSSFESLGGSLHKIKTEEEYKFKRGIINTFNSFFKNAGIEKPNEIKLLEKNDLSGLEKLSPKTVKDMYLLSLKTKLLNGQINEKQHLKIKKDIQGYYDKNISAIKDHKNNILIERETVFSSIVRKIQDNFLKKDDTISKNIGFLNLINKNKFLGYRISLGRTNGELLFEYMIKYDDYNINKKKENNAIHHFPLHNLFNKKLIGRDEIIEFFRKIKMPKEKDQLRLADFLSKV